MKPQYLFHGSAKNIHGKLVPHTPDDTTQSENCVHAVYATNRKDIALGMALSSQKGTKSFGDYHEQPYRSVFVESEPDNDQTVYLYIVSSETFEETPKGSHQWISHEPVLIVQKQLFLAKTLSAYWRKATPEEATWYYKQKNDTLRTT